MKNKTAIILITAVITLLCLYYISFTFIARSVQSKATSVATDPKTGVIDPIKKRRYLDSVWTKPVFNFLGLEYTYQDIKKKEIALGLDLQGGMHVILEVSPIEILKAMAGNPSDAKFNEAIKNAQTAQQTSNRNFLTLFQREYEKLAPAGKLSNYFANVANRGRINLNSSNDEVMNIVREEVDNSFDRAFQIIRKRIDKFGVTNPNITKIPGTNRILVELPGVENPERVRKLLAGVAKLEFWEVHEMQDVFPGWQQLSAYVTREEAQKKLAKTPAKNAKEDGLAAKDDKGSSLVAADEQKEAKKDSALAPKTEKKDSTKATELAAKSDSSKKDTAVAKKEAKKDSTAAANFQLMVPTPEGFIVKLADTARVNELLNRPEVRGMFPSTVKFLYDAKTNTKDASLMLYPIKRGKGGKPVLEGDVIENARQDFDRGKPDVNMQMNSAGAKQWKKVTSANVGKRIAIVLDDFVYSAPRVNGEIPNGSSQISGNFTVEEAKELASVLESGKLPAPVRIVEEATVGPSLGLESINQGLNSMLVGLGLVVVFMVLYYNTSGFMANIALLFNLFFILGILVQLNLVLTLAGMAGIVLTIGMSIDANVLIYERIREELRNGKSRSEAISLGYEKAYRSIIDANVTTILIAFVLYTLGTGGIKGFAVTLIIGIVCSVFTAVFITRLLIEYTTRHADSKLISFKGFIFNNLFNNAHFGFVTLRRHAYLASALIIGIGFALIAVQGGLNFGVDFKGGRSYVIEFSAPVRADEARAAVAKTIEGASEVKTYGSNNKLKITTGYLITDESEAADKKVETALMKGLEQFKSLNPKIVSTSKVGATIADDIYQTSLWTIAISLLAIFLYIFVRFHHWQYGLGAVVALFHDVLMVFAWMAIARAVGLPYEVDQVFIAAVLTVIGYSINDTVVVFDRIREFAGDTKDANFADKMNSALNETLSRTIMTAGTTLFVVIALYFLGGQVLANFSYALLVGLIFGTYSSVFIASPIVVDITKLQLNRKSNTPAA